MRIRQVFTITAVLVFSGGVFAACGSDDKDGGAADDTTTIPRNVGVSTTDGASAGTTITITASDFKFDPATITAAAGQAVTFTIKNTGKTEHNLTIEKLKVDKDAEGGESASQTVTPAAGTYEYFCHYHPDSMKGTLTVS